MVGEESIFDFSDVPLAFDESAFEYFGVTLAREEDCLGVLPDPDRRCESHFIHFDYREYIYLKLATVKVFLQPPLFIDQKGIEQD